MNNPYWKNICAIAERQRAKGIATYGQGIEMNPADVITRIEHLQEELVDALMYCEWIKDGIKGTGNWIPVTERLPDRECIAIGYQNEMVIGYISENRYSKTGFSVEGAGEYLGEVTHWMPLPEPPKEG